MKKLFSALVVGAFLLFASVAIACAGTDVTLEWDPNSEADLAGYMMYYSVNSDGPPYNGTGAPEGNSPIDVGNVTMFKFTNLADGTYYFVVTAYDTGSRESGYSNEVSEFYDTTSPAHPTGLKIILSVTVIINTQ